MGACRSKGDRPSDSEHDAAVTVGDSTVEEGSRPAMTGPMNRQLLLVKDPSECSSEEILAMTDGQLEMKKRMQSVWEARVKLFRQEAEYRRKLDAREAMAEDEESKLTPRSKEANDLMRARGKLHDSLSDVFRAADWEDTGELHTHQLVLAADAIVLALENQTDSMKQWSACWRSWALDLQQNVEASRLESQPRALGDKLVGLGKASMNQFTQAFVDKEHQDLVTPRTVTLATPRTEHTGCLPEGPQSESFFSGLGSSISAGATGLVKTVTG